MNELSIAIIGAGGWGLALSNVLSEKHKIKTWVHSKKNYDTISSSYMSENYLKGVELNRSIRFTMDIYEAINGADIIIIATPSFGFYEVCKDMSPHIKDSQIIISTTKGLEKKTGRTMSEVARGILKRDILTLSGPSHAEETAKGVPTAMVIAGKKEISEYIRDSLIVAPKLRIYSSLDQIGVEIGGSLKNIIAIAGGIVDGLKLGDNAKAALITRGLHEIVRFALDKGACIETLYGLSGIGDLIVTCSSNLSRNNRLGRALANGKKYEDVIAESRGQVAEGVYATMAAYEYSISHNIYMPIAEAIYDILFNNTDILKTIDDLMSREAKNESFF